MTKLTDHLSGAIAHNGSTRFFEVFNREADNMMELVGERLLEATEMPVDLTQESIIGQLLMEFLVNHPLDSDTSGASLDNAVAGNLSPEQKIRLMHIANHIGPDYAQAIYHAAVFMTKVA